MSAAPTFGREHVAGLTLGPDLLIGLDIDGTILGLDDSLSRRVQRSISRVVESGARLVLATGRSLIAVLPVVERLGLQKGFAVCSNGAVTIAFDERGHEMVDVITFDPGPALRLLREHAPDVIFAVEDLGRGFKVTRPFPEGELTGTQEVVSFEDLVAAPATRVTLRAPEWSSQEFHDLVDKSGLHGVSYAVGWSAWLDMTPEGVSKASALEAVRQRYHVPAHRTLVVGDGQNDIEMFRWAGVSVAMDGADETTKAAATAVTGPVELDGLVSVLDAVPST
ncbi:HAD family hydrolase [Pseudactinotalea terrae]|uniref:HAD family hydrolase n=1 Tax=Pseudactinotalea terrae TaxID=1743262 RepID=UPI0019D54D3E|nr:HAD family hydrolase [Pseudactinotalea terrae]